MPCNYNKLISQVMSKLHLNSFIWVYLQLA